MTRGGSYKSNAFPARRRFPDLRPWRKSREATMRTSATEAHMPARVLAMTSFVLLALLFIPAAAFAQSGIAGVVKDASGAVLPGVTVEAASPVLIEKVRSVT